MSIAYEVLSENINGQMAPFNPQMAQTIFAELVERIDYLEERLIQVEEERDQVREENTQLREELRDAREINDIRAIRIANLESNEDWTRRLFRNPHLAASVKIVLWLIYFHVIGLRVDPHEKTGVTLERVAQDAGMSVDTVRRVNEHLSTKTDCLQVEHETKVRDDGEVHTYVSVQLGESVKSPDFIQVEGGNQHGGKRVKGCTKCGGTTNNYTLKHCPECGNIELYGQPGNPADADVRQAMDAVVCKVEQIKANFSEQDKQEPALLPTSFDGTEFATAESELPDLLDPWEPEPEAEHQAPQPIPEDGGLSEIFTGTCTCSDCGRPLAMITRHGWEVYECPHCQRE